MKIAGVAEDLNVSASKVGPFKSPALGRWLTKRADEFDSIVWARPDRGRPEYE